MIPIVLISMSSGLGAPLWGSEEVLMGSEAFLMGN